MPTAIAKINLAALQHNVSRIRIRAPRASIIAMVKANAYGHGLLTIAQALSGVEALGVSHTQEALLLRQSGITQRIVVMGGFHDPAELHLLSQYQVDAVIHQMFQLEILERQSLQSPLKVWLKINTGMHRIGFAPEQVQNVYQRLHACHSVSLPIALMTHFSDADDRGSTKTAAQLALFNKVTAGLIGERSVANSAALLSDSQTHYDWVRPGIMLYGIAPFEGEIAAEYDLQPVMTLSSKIIALHDFPAGAQIGYGSTYQCPQDMRVGVVAIGYGDGYPRHAATGTPVLIKRQRCRVLGRVSMDMLSVDLTSVPSVKIGDEAILWGEGLPVEEIAQHAQTIPYQLVTGVTTRVRYVTTFPQNVSLPLSSDLQLS